VPRQQRGHFEARLPPQTMRAPPGWAPSPAWPAARQHGRAWQVLLKHDCGSPLSWRTPYFGSCASPTTGPGACHPSRPADLIPLEQKNGGMSRKGHVWMGKWGHCRCCYHTHAVTHDDTTHGPGWRPVAGMACLCLCLSLVHEVWCLLRITCCSRYAHVRLAQAIMQPPPPLPVALPFAHVFVVWRYPCTRLRPCGVHI
jgi:hypothetical protein